MNQHTKSPGTASIADLGDEIDRSLQKIAVSGIRIEQTSAIHGYLTDHADLLDAVVACCAAARVRFPAATQLSLALYADPEIDDRYLTLYVRPPEYDEGILSQVEAFAVECDPTLNGKSGTILLTTDFRAPRAWDAV